MAITKIAMRSSTIAKAAKNIFKLVGTLLSNNEITANTKAISVTMGIPQPESVGVPELKNK